ncbi:MAG: sulfatase-like hydrolase/transferase [Roseburia sp.]|nr:sulfatase-like hydrolase/transferase [Roseburia sp.]
MSDQGELHYRRGMIYFEAGQHEQAVLDWIFAFEFGYEKEAVLQNLYQAFVYPNEQEFRQNYEKNSEGISRMPYDACVLDFIPVSDMRFYIFDREEQKFCGFFEVEKTPIVGEKTEFHDILYTDTWDMRDMLPDLKANRRDVVYLLLEGLEQKFMSFCKLPNFREFYLANVIVFQNEILMRLFFEENEEYYLPKKFVTTEQEKYAAFFQHVHKKRICHMNRERKDIFLSVCIQSHNRGREALDAVRHLLGCFYDSEMEIVFLNNGSTEDLEEYRKISKLEDRRLRYIEYKEYQGKKAGIIKTLELAQGMFAVLAENEYLIDQGGLEEYLDLLKEYASCGVILEDGEAGESVKLCKKGVEAVKRLGGYYPETGVAFNMILCHREHVLEEVHAIRDNEFAENYPHICLAMLLSRQYDCLVTNQELWGKRSDISEYREKDTSLPLYIRPQNRIAQQDGYMEFWNNCFDFGKEEFIEIFASRCKLTYALINIAFDNVAGFSQFGSRQEIYDLIYHGQEKYLKNFPISLSRQEYTLLQNRIQAMLHTQQIRSSGRWLAREGMHPLKQQIKELAESHAEPEKVSELVKTYEIQFPKDFDLYALKAWLRFQEGDTEEGYRIIQDGIKSNPYNYVANQIARMLCRKTGRYVEAIKHDDIIAMLQEEFPYLPAVEPVRAELEKELNKYSSRVMASGSQKAIEKNREDIRYLNTHINKRFGLADFTYYGGGNNIVGKEYENIDGVRKYNGFYEDTGLEILLPELAVNNISWWVTKLECREILRTDHLTLDTDTECLLPVLQEENETSYTFTLPDGNEVTCRNKKAKHFEYYRLPPKTRLDAENTLCIGSPIELKQDPGIKKMVLSIFVDGISQKVIEEEGLKNVMPNTYAFFSKGSCCTNAYTTGEWTLPALASCMTGLSPTEHMLIHNKLTKSLPEDIPVLAEYFKEQGYQTAKIDGNWRFTMTYGYGRGMDRVIYQHQQMGMKVEQVVADVLDHMELMRETNQFICMGVADLHNIADGFAQRHSLQAGIPLNKRSAEDAGITSVKQTYSENKRAAYIKQMKHVDAYLAHIYRYLEETYEDEEIIVSLFGDHGQGYLVKDEEHFLSAGRSKVAMMFRGGDGPNGVCDEVVSVCDYTPILCRLAGIPMKDKKIEGSLPLFFGGEKERKYAITESIHPGDIYQAAVVSKDHAFYFTSGGLVEYDGRFELGEYKSRLLKKTGEECLDEERKEQYLHVLMHHIASLLIY